MTAAPLRALRRGLPWGVLLLVFALCAVELGAWVDRNGLMDGYQNEAIHVTNAMDLWRAWAARDGYTLRQIVLTYYWPPGFYIWPAPLYRWLGVSHAAMVTANLGHLAVLLLSVYALAAALSDRWGGALAAAIVATYPSIVGNLMRYEPSVAVTAWVTLGTYCLLRSRGFSDRRWSLGFGLACGAGLLMDRLSLAVFLALPALVVAASALRRPGAGRRALNAAGALGLTLAISGWWLVSFYHYNRYELLAQVYRRLSDEEAELFAAANTALWSNEYFTAVYSLLFYQRMFRLRRHCTVKELNMFLRGCNRLFWHDLEANRRGRCPG